MRQELERLGSVIPYPSWMKVIEGAQNGIPASNAKLIACAPEMAKMLQRFRGEWQCVCKLNAVVAPFGSGVECKICAVDVLLKKAGVL